MSTSLPSWNVVVRRGGVGVALALGFALSAFNSGRAGTPCSSGPQVTAPRGPCYGYFPTRWRPWPVECQTSCGTCLEGSPTPAGAMPVTIEAGSEPFPIETAPETVPPPLAPDATGAGNSALEPPAAPLPGEPPLGEPSSSYLDEPASAIAPPAVGDATGPAPVVVPTLEPDPGFAPPPTAPNPELESGPGLPDDSPVELVPPGVAPPVTDEADEAPEPPVPNPNWSGRLQRLPAPIEIASRAPLRGVERRVPDTHPALWSRRPAADAGSHDAAGQGSPTSDQTLRSAARPAGWGSAR